MSERPLFATFTGVRQGRPAQGWVVINDFPPVLDADDITKLIDTIEKARGYDMNTVCLISFQRLEHPPA